MRSTLKAWTSLLALTTALGFSTLAEAQEGRDGPANEARRSEARRAAAVRAAAGEEPDPNVPVQERLRPDYDPLGIRAGSFFIFPSLTLEGSYDDNVFATPNDEDDDFVALLTPEINVQSNWSRHELSLTAGGAFSFYEEFDERDYEDLSASAQGRLDITRDDALLARAGIERLHEEPDSPDSPGAAGLDIVEYLSETAGLVYRRNFNRLTTSIGGDITRLDFEDENGVNQDDRDRNQYRARARAGYELSPRIGVFTEGTYDVRRYDETPDDGGTDRDSEGFNVRVGSGVDITSIIFGEAAIGYTYRQYEDDELDSVSGVGGAGAVTWNVTPLTSIIVSAEAEILESTITFDGDQASGNFQKSATVDVWHELLRNVLLNGNVGYVRDDFEGTERSDDTLFAGVGLRYLLNRRLSLDANYDFRTRESDSDDAEYTRNIFRVGLTAQL